MDIHFSDIAIPCDLASVNLVQQKQKKCVFFNLDFFYLFYNSEKIGHTQETLVFRYGTVVQTSESSADRLKVDRRAESNRIHIFGNDSDQCRRIQILQIFNPFFDTTFLLKI